MILTEIAAFNVCAIVGQVRWSEPSPVAPPPESGGARSAPRGEAVGAQRRVSGAAAERGARSVGRLADA